MSNNKKILAIAYACSPYQGSEAGVGWGWVQMIGRNHEVIVITATRYRQDIERYCVENGPLQNVKFHYIRHEWSRTLDRLFPPYYLVTYNRWLKEAYKLACQLVADQSLKLCHLITYVGFRHPGEFYKLDCPFIWGPIGGLENTPWRLLPAMGTGGAFYYAMRNINNSLDKRFLNGPKAAMKKAAKHGAVIAATSSIQREIRRWYGVESSVICEIGTQEHVQAEINKRNNEEPLRICWSGEHLPGKALPLLFAALKRMSSETKWNLDILGDGHCGKRWTELAQDMGFNDRCTWHGKIPREDALNVMGDSHLFVITSLKDLTSSVLLEALSLGVPVICPAHCGFSDVVDESCGVKIPVGDADQMSKAFLDTITMLAQDEKQRRALSCGALVRAKKYSWDNKSTQLEEIYQQVLARDLE